jgi:ABC-type transport system involved in cytochrome bd biosynthesis fused ATPase/permease subunit
MTINLFKVTAFAAATLVTFAAAAVVTMPAYAGQRQDTIDANQAIERQRIEDARLKGELNRREYRALNAEQARIAEMERQAKADGHISKSEYNRIHDAQINAYRNIKSESTDKEGSFIRRWLYRHPGNR